MHATAASRGEDSAPLGILAGGSGVPVELAVAVMSHGRTVHIVGLEGEAEPEIGAFPHTWVNWGGIGAMIRAFRNAGCRQIVIVGRVRRRPREPDDGRSSSEHLERPCGPVGPDHLDEVAVAGLPEDTDGHALHLH